MTQPPSPPAVGLTAASLLVALEGLALVVGGVVYASGAGLGVPENLLGSVVGGALAAGTGLLLLVVARGLRAHRAWAWSPTVVVQAFLLVVAYGLAQGRVYAVAAPLALLALAVLALLVTPQSRAAFRALR